MDRISLLMMGLAYKMNTIKSNISFKPRDILFVSGLLFCLSLIPIAPSFSKIIIIDFIIIITYLIFTPKYILHPNNIVFAFSLLYVVIPSLIDLTFVIFDLSYHLPQERIVSWDEFYLQTYFDMIFLYLVLFFTFRFYIREDTPQVKLDYYIHIKFVIFLYFMVFMLLLYWMQATGGLENWIFNYKTTFLIGRSGHGLLNFIMLFLVNIVVFLLGLHFFHLKSTNKLIVLILSFILIFFASYVQGLKSRFIILLIIFYFPYLLHMKLNIKQMTLLGILFFTLLFIGTYVRTNGYYNSPTVFLEYMMTYFNVYSLHDMIIDKDMMDIGKTFFQFLNKPLQMIGLIDNNVNYDLSIMLTKEYFPNDWETMKATQQWPVVTELYYNFFGFIFGWIPLLIYAYIISKLYILTKNGHIGISLIYILEFIRLFSVMRGTLIPWQIFIYLFFYILIYFVVTKTVILKKENA